MPARYLDGQGNRGYAGPVGEMILAVANRKGGSRKTTVCGHLAGVLSRRHAVRLVDADPQGSLAAWLGDFLPVTHAPNAVALERALVARGSGLLLVDCPPFDARLAALAVERATLVIVPVAPSPLDVRAAAPLLEGLAQGGKRALVVLNAVRARTKALETAREAVRQFGVPVARTSLGFRVAFVEAVAAGVPVTKYAGKSKAAEEIEALAAEVLRHLRRK